MTPTIKKKDLKEVIETYLSKVDGNSWNTEYSVEGFNRKISYGAINIIFKSLDVYLQKVLKVADFISKSNGEQETSEETAYSSSKCSPSEEVHH